MFAVCWILEFNPNARPTQLAGALHLNVSFFLDLYIVAELLIHHELELGPFLARQTVF